MELFVGREVLRAGLTSLRASFTVSHQGEYLGFLFWFLCLLFRAVLLLFVPLGIPPFLEYSI